MNVGLTGASNPAAPSLSFFRPPFFQRSLCPGLHLPQMVTVCDTHVRGGGFVDRGIPVVLSLAWHHFVLGQILR